MSKVSRSRIANAIAEKSLASGISQQYAREMAAYLIQDKRTGELDSILRDVQLAWAESGYVEAVVTSAHPLSSDTKQEIIRQIKAEYPGAKKISLSEVHDPELIGGVRVNLPDQQLDLTIKSKLHKFRQSVLQGGV